MNLRAAQVRIYIDADLLGLGKSSPASATT
jgi:hypothetical protein